MIIMEFYDAKKVTAKKEHKCEMCGGIIAVGEKYWQEKGKFEGYFFYRSMHTYCHNMESEFCSEVDNEFAWDDIMEFIQERYCDNCEHSLLNEDKENWTECEYHSFIDCPKIREKFKDGDT